MNLEAIAAAFREAMCYLWPTSRRMSREQHRDLVRIFLMGYGEAILAECQDGEEKFIEFNEVCAVTQSPNWFPNSLWHWGPDDAA